MEESKWVEYVHYNGIIYTTIRKGQLRDGPPPDEILKKGVEVWRPLYLTDPDLSNPGRANVCNGDPWNALRKRVQRGGFMGPVSCPCACGIAPMAINYCWLIIHDALPWLEWLQLKLGCCQFVAIYKVPLLHSIRLNNHIQHWHQWRPNCSMGLSGPYCRAAPGQAPGLLALGVDTVYATRAAATRCVNAWNRCPAALVRYGLLSW